MKTWIYLSIGLLVFMALIYSGQVYLHRSSSRLAEDLDRVSQTLTRKNWAETLTHFAKTERAWDKVKRWWAALTHHEQINLVDQSFIRTREAMVIQDYSQARMELGILRHLVDHVVRREEFSFSNIF